MLEIGCGVGRIGLELALRCRFWTGVDISANMLAVASERLSGLKNVRLTKLAAHGGVEMDGQRPVLGTGQLIYVPAVTRRFRCERRSCSTIGEN